MHGARTFGWLATVALALVAQAPVRGDSPAGPPEIDVRCEGVTHLGVGVRVPLSLTAYRDGKTVRCVGMTFAAEPRDVAEVTADGFLVGRAPGRVNVTATLPGVGTSLARTLWVVDGLEGGTLPRLVGVKDTQEWELDWLVGDQGQSGLRLAWQGLEQALGLGVSSVPPGPPPWTIPLDPARASWGSLELGRAAAWEALRPRSGSVHLDRWDAGVVQGRVELEGADGVPLVLGFTAALPPPIAPGLVDRLVETREERLLVEGRHVRVVHAWPRTTKATRRLLLVPPATGLDDAVVRTVRQFALRGFDARAVDVHRGATAPDPTVLAEGHVPRDDIAARRRAAIARATDARHVQAVLVRALGEPDASGSRRPLGVVAWGETCEHAVRAVSAAPGTAGTVLIDPPGDARGELLGAALGPTCVVLGTRTPAAAGVADALRRVGTAHERRVEVHAVPSEVAGFSDPRWHLGYGSEATQAAHARLLAFLERTVR
jgi:dienelactone hydrolase